MDPIVDEAALPGLIDLFYSRVRVDPLIGPLFNDAIDDWPDHLTRLSDFWSSVMLTTGRYKGNPIAKHVRHVQRLDPAMFDRWLAIWTDTTAEVLLAPAAAAMQAKATRIAESLQLALRLKP